MRKNVLISLTVAGALILGSVTVLAGNMISKKVECPNCGAEIYAEDQNLCSRCKEHEDLCLT